LSCNICCVSLLLAEEGIVALLEGCVELDVLWVKNCGKNVTSKIGKEYPHVKLLIQNTTPM
jgi:hypothetical protein